MTLERLFGALAALWIFFAALIVIVSTFLSPMGFQLPVPGRNVSESVIGALFYTPPVICAGLWLRTKISSEERPHASKIMGRVGWTLVMVLGGMAAVLALGTAKLFFIG